MTDSIQAALNKVGIATPDVIEQDTPTVTTTLPVEKCAILIKKQLEGEKFKLKSKLDVLEVQNKQAELQELATGALLSAVSGRFSSKLPVLDRKQLELVSIQNKAKEIATERAKVSRDTLTKAADLYTYELPNVSGNVISSCDG